MNDQCRTVAVTLQENGIVRSINGHIIGRLATMDGLDFNAIPAAGLCTCPKPTILEKSYCTQCGRDMHQWQQRKERR